MAWPRRLGRARGWKGRWPSSPSLRPLHGLLGVLTAGRPETKDGEAWHPRDLKPHPGWKEGLREQGTPLWSSECWHAALIRHSRAPSPGRWPAFALPPPRLTRGFSAPRAEPQLTLSVCSRGWAGWAAAPSGPSSSVLRGSSLLNISRSQSWSHCETSLLGSLSGLN